MTTTPTPPALNTEWDFQSGSALKDYLFPEELTHSTDTHTFGKSSISNPHRSHQQSKTADRSMVNSSQESDFYGFTPTSAVSVEHANTFLEKISEHSDDINGDEGHDSRYEQDELAVANNDATTGITTTLLRQHRLHEKLCSTIPTEYGLEQTIASEEFSDQDIRCQIEMANNVQQLKARMSNIAVDECNDTHLSIEPTSSDDDENENDASLYQLGSPPAPSHHNEEDDDADDTAIATPTMATATVVSAISSFHTHFTLDEDSNNAVDNAISNGQCTIGDSSTPNDLSFNGKLKKLQPPANESNVVSCNSNKDPHNQSDSHEEKDLTITATAMINGKSDLELQLQLESSREHINERSPDLFSDAGDFENEAIHDDDIAAAVEATATAATSTVDEDDDLGTDVSGINDSADIKTDDETRTTILPDKHIEKTERTLNRRIQTLLSGIIPPPSVTFIQHDASNLLSTYQRNVTLMNLPTSITCNNNQKQNDDVIDAIPQMPEQLENIEWPQLRRANAYGVHYNRTKYTDNIEIMYMKLVERYVGRETTSSFTQNATDNNSSAAAAKRKPIRKL